MRENILIFHFNFIAQFINAAKKNISKNKIHENLRYLKDYHYLILLLKYYY